MFEPISTKVSLRDQIVQNILEKIDGGELKAGDKLPAERELAELYNISRTTIRDALRTLAGLGVVSIQHGRGIFISAGEGSALGQLLFGSFLSKPDTIIALFEVRRTLESAAAAWAAERATPDQRRELQVLLASAKQEGESIVPHQAALADQAFHTLLVTSTQNPIAARIMINLLDVLEEARKESLVIAGRAWQSVNEHQQIVEAIIHRDPDRARAAMIAHLNSVERAILKNLNTNP